MKNIIYNVFEKKGFVDNKAFYSQRSYRECNYYTWISTFYRSPNKVRENCDSALYTNKISTN